MTPKFLISLFKTGTTIAHDTYPQSTDIVIALRVCLNWQFGLGIHDQTTSPDLVSSPCECPNAIREQATIQWVESSFLCMLKGRYTVHYFCLTDP